MVGMTKIQYQLDENRKNPPFICTYAKIKGNHVFNIMHNYDYNLINKVEYDFVKNAQMTEKLRVEDENIWFHVLTVEGFNEPGAEVSVLIGSEYTSISNFHLTFTFDFNKDADLDLQQKELERQCRECYDAKIGLNKAKKAYKESRLIGDD